MQTTMSAQVGSNKVEYIRDGSSSSEPLVFLHGFGVHPGFYRALIGELGNTYEVIAPKMYGMNEFIPQPLTIEDYAAFTADFFSAIRIGQHHLAGHSLGGAVAMRVATGLEDAVDLVAVNPVLPSDNGIVNFLLKAGYKGVREMSGVAGGMEGIKFGWTVPLPFGWNVSKDPKSSLAIIKDMCTYGFQGVSISKPVFMLYGGDDEYFELSRENAGAIRKAVPKIRIKNLEGKNHDWLIFYPGMAAFEIGSFLHG